MGVRVGGGGGDGGGKGESVGWGVRVGVRLGGRGSGEVGRLKGMEGQLRTVAIDKKKKKSLRFLHSYLIIQC